MQSDSITPDITRYRESGEYLRDLYSRRQQANPKLSVRSWAKKMGFPNHTVLTLLLQGKRSVRPQHMTQLAQGMGLQGRAREYFEALVLLENAKSESERKLYESRLRRLAKGSTSPPLLELDRFRAISDWLCIVVLEMTALKDFRAEPRWIARRLGDKLRSAKAREILARLLKLGLVQDTPAGLRKMHGELTVASELRSEAIRDYHRGAINGALAAVDAQDASERILSAFTMTIDPSKLAEAEPLIQKFRTSLEALLEATPGDETYQCNIQLFRVTEPLEKK